jgi:hypothetical protein
MLGRLNLWPGVVGTVLALLISTWVSIRGWQDIPDGIRPRAVLKPLIGATQDEYGKVEILVDMPVLILAISVLFVVLPLMLPHGEYLADSMVLYNAAWLGTVALATIQHVDAVARAARDDAPFGIFGIALVLILFGGHLRRLGVRALGPRPWPRRSEWHPWARTYHQAGMVLAMLGLALNAARALVAGPALVPAFLVATLVACAVPMVFSWRQWLAGPAAPSGPGHF